MRLHNCSTFLGSLSKLFLQTIKLPSVIQQTRLNLSQKTSLLLIYNVQHRLLELRSCIYSLFKLLKRLLHSVAFQKQFQFVFVNLLFFESGCDLINRTLQDSRVMLCLEDTFLQVGYDNIVGSLHTKICVVLGGSVSNVVVKCLKNTTGFAQIQVTPYNVAMAGRVGDDLLGQYFKNSMTQNGVEFLSPSQPGTSTGTVIVLTTPDAQRTFLAFQGDSNFEVPADHLEIFTKAKIIVIEGYLLEHQNSLEKILKIINFAKQAGVLTAVSAGDPGLVKRCRTAFNKIIESGVDIFLSNQAEAVTFLELPQSTDAQDAAMLLGKRCPIAVVTDGSKGSHIYEQQQDKCYSMKPYWTSEPPVDTTGAGDAYAAGLLFGMIMGLQFQNCGELGSRMASAVIGQIGCRVRQEEADEVYNQFVNDVQEVRELIQSPI
eukprot:TRINITY_DN8258_c0_g1_i2.p1 TRINITY_DN8258_c0_g1~~TRINITY_DN8258_c0_g1_i2.p1  ORF type:complete len:431 (-),score=26.37 TRINITY_DN8258_c0_g1_i2:2536-3828(-)